MSNDELRSMCERAIQHGIGGELRWIAVELLARLDAEAAQEEHKISADWTGEYWLAQTFDDKFEVMLSERGATAIEAVAACVAKIKTLTPKETP